MADVLAVLNYPSLFVTFSATAIASFAFVLVVAFKASCVLHVSRCSSDAGF